MQELKEYHITANGYDMKTGKYTIPECYVTAPGYIAAAEVLSEYLATGANADQVRLATPTEPELDEQQQNFIKHAAGVNYGNTAGVNYLKKHKKSYRGYYAVNPENYERYAELKKLAELGYFDEGTGSAPSYVYFHLTAKGIAEAAALVGVKL